MKDAKCIHELARPGTKAGKIRFIHFRDGKEHTFYTCVNDLAAVACRGSTAPRRMLINP